MSQGSRGHDPRGKPWEHAEAHTKPRGTPVGDRSPEDGRSSDDGKPGRRNRQEGRTRETVAAPAGGKASKWKSRERCREGTLPTRSGREQTVKRVETRKADRAEPQGPARIGRTMRCGDAKPQESHRERTLFTRRPATNTRRADLTLGGMPIRTSESGAYEGGDVKPFRTSMQSSRKVNPVETRGDGAHHNP